jgi:LysM repeat protein
MKQFWLFIVIVSTHLSTMAQGRTEYIAQWREEAVYQMVQYKIPASITLAQAILESGDGKSRLATKANNHFGIKCHSTWEGDRMYADDDEKNECFRSYSNAKESFKDHSEFLLQKRYKSLFELDIDDYKGWAKGLKECGYATNPKYPQLLIELIETHHLQQFDKEGMDHLKKGTTPDHGSDNPRNSKKEKEKKSKTNSNDTKSHGREIHVSDNRIKYVIAKPGDTPQSIADDFGLNVLFIQHYNDLDKKSVLKEGQVVYIQNKRRSAEIDYVTVEENQTLAEISQKYGVRENLLRDRNELKSGEEPAAGMKLRLNSQFRMNVLGWFKK